MSYLWTSLELNVKHEAYLTIVQSTLPRFSDPLPEALQFKYFSSATKYGCPVLIRRGIKNFCNFFATACRIWGARGLLFLPLVVVKVVPQVHVSETTNKRNRRFCMCAVCMWNTTVNIPYLLRKIKHIYSVNLIDSYSAWNFVPPELARIGGCVWSLNVFRDFI